MENMNYDLDWLKLYYYDNDLILELWGASTKHPDIVFRFSSFEKSQWIDEKYQVFQWVLECASTLNFPMTAKGLAQFALDNLVNWENGN